MLTISKTLVHCGERRWRATDAGEWERIVPGVRGDLDHQQSLTDALAGARPSRLERPDRPDDWPAVIGDLLGAPVVLESYGPGTTDKRVPSGRTAAAASMLTG